MAHFKDNFMLTKNQIGTMSLEKLVFLLSIIQRNVNFVVEISSRAHFKGDFMLKQKKGNLEAKFLFNS